MIRAEVHSDDFVAEAKFDATPWFEQATDQEIIDLMMCGWGGNYQADEVAEWTAGREPEVNTVFNYIHLRRRVGVMGFECHVNDDDALEWLRQHRPVLLADHVTSAAEPTQRFKTTHIELIKISSTELPHHPAYVACDLRQVEAVCGLMGTTDTVWSQAQIDALGCRAAKGEFCMHTVGYRTSILLKSTQEEL